MGACHLVSSLFAEGKFSCRFKGQWVREVEDFVLFPLIKAEASRQASSTWKKMVLPNATGFLSKLATSGCEEAVNHRYGFERSAFSFGEEQFRDSHDHLNSSLCSTTFMSHLMSSSRMKPYVHFTFNLWLEGAEIDRSILEFMPMKRLGFKEEKKDWVQSHTI